jgi:hypothetical protein
MRATVRILVCEYSNMHSSRLPLLTFRFVDTTLTGVLEGLKPIANEITGQINSLVRRLPFFNFSRGGQAGLL